MATLLLEPGYYFFKTLSDANLKVVRGGVNTTAGTNDHKDPWPDPGSQSPQPAPGGSGDDPPGEVPRLTVE